MADKKLPDSAADRMFEHDTSIDSLISNPAGPGILKDAQEQATELQQLQIENKLLRDKYNLHDPEDSREALFREQIEEEVYRTQEFVSSEEGAQQIRQGIIEDWQQGPKEKTSDDVYVEGFKKRLAREQAQFDEDE
jgi:hypothetical protein